MMFEARDGFVEKPKDDCNPIDLGSEFVSSAWKSGVQNPLLSLAQITGSEERLEPEEKKSGWMGLAQSAGSAAGQIGDFMLLSGLLHGNVAGQGSELLAANAVKERVLAGATLGALQGTVLTPLYKGEDGSNRLKNGITQAVTFGTMEAAFGALSQGACNKFIASGCDGLAQRAQAVGQGLDQGLFNAASKSTWTGKAAAKLYDGLHGVPDALNQGYRNFLSQDMRSTLGKYTLAPAREILQTAVKAGISGGAGGLVNVNSRALLNDGRLASLPEDLQGVTSYGIANALMRGECIKEKPSEGGGFGPNDPPPPSESGAGRGPAIKMSEWQPGIDAGDVRPLRTTDATEALKGSVPIDGGHGKVTAEAAAYGSASAGGGGLIDWGHDMVVCRFEGNKPLQPGERIVSLGKDFEGKSIYCHEVDGVYNVKSGDRFIVRDLPGASSASG